MTIFKKCSFPAVESECPEGWDLYQDTSPATVLVELAWLILTLLSMSAVAPTADPWYRSAQRTKTTSSRNCSAETLLMM